MQLSNNDVCSNGNMKFANIKLCSWLNMSHLVLKLNYLLIYYISHYKRTVAIREIRTELLKNAGSLISNFSKFPANSPAGNVIKN